MTVREALERYGPTLTIVVALVLLVALMPGGGTNDVTATRGAGAGPDAGGDAGGVVAGTTGDAGAASGRAGPAAGTGGASGSPEGEGTGPGGATGAGSTEPPPDMVVGWGGDADCRPDGRQPGIAVYMPPCVPRFTGDNGGATARGVDADHIVIARWMPQSDAASEAAVAATGIDDTAEDRDRIYEAARRYANAHYETYGREVVFVDVPASGPVDNDEAMRADAIRIADQLGAFGAMLGPASPTTLAHELAHRNVVVTQETALPRPFYESIPPRLFSIMPTPEVYFTHIAEYIGKRLAGRNAEHAGDAEDVTMRQRYSESERRFGLIWIEGAGEKVDPYAKRSRDFFVDELARYGVRLSADVSYQFDLARQQTQSTNVISRMRNEQVSTLAFVGDPLTPIFLTQEATRQNYFPEWLITGAFLTDLTFTGRLYDQRQWRHAFGISPLYVFTQSVQASPGYREYFHARPDDQDGDQGASANGVRNDVSLMFTGIHLAGPNLTPDTFARAMFEYPPTGGTPGAPLFHFTERDPTAISDFTEVFWHADGQGPDEIDNNGRGILLKVDGGRRYQAGEWPTTPPRVFDLEGTAFLDDFEDGGGFTVPHEQDGHQHPPEQRCRSCD